MSDLTPAMVRDYLTATNTSGQWSDGLIGSNISTALGLLQRETHRQFEPQGSNTAVTKKFSTRGRSYMVLPGLVAGSNTTVTYNASDLTDGESYHLISDRFVDGVYTAIQIPQLRDAGDYRSRSDWYDRNLDHWHWRGDRLYYLENDLVITGQWGHYPYPADMLHAWKVLAAFLTIRPDALLSGARQTPEGNVFDLSRWPLEVQTFVRDWTLQDYA